MAKGIKTESVADIVNAMKMNSAGVDILGLELHEPFRDKLQELSDNGVVRAWKAMGAGGGGVVGIILDSSQNSHEVINRLEAIGWSNIPWKIDNDGVVRKEINL